VTAGEAWTQEVLAELRAAGFTDEVLGRLKAPAGLDIGAATGPEIALSILAEIVQRRRARAPQSAAAAQPEAAAGRGVAIDPMCGMEVEISSARWTAERDGETFYFCAPGCRKAFIAQSAPDPGGRPR
jgi:xanthine dehydrogenase accessory factor